MSCLAQDTILYKEIDTIQLYLEIHRPEKVDQERQSPAIVFFFGGGWNGGDRQHFAHHAAYFTQRGLISILADYRINKLHQTTPFEAVKDAKSAMRFVRAHAEELGIDADKIIAAGGSAGGHLAAATALVETYNESNEDTTVSCVPNALVLFNPVIDNGPGGYGFERIGNEYLQFSPLHRIKKGTPPTIMFLGTKDELIPVVTAEYYQTMMERVGSRCELYLYKGEGHGFFNYHNFKRYKDTLKKADKFLQSLGYLDKYPLVSIE